MNIEEIEQFIPKDRIYINEPMNKHTSFKIGGPAEYLIKIQTAEEIKSILKLSKEQEMPLTIIGNGSNILVSDEGIKGIVLKIEIPTFELDNQTAKIKVGSGVKLAFIAQKCLKQEIAGFEFASGIPGTIGGAIRMNAGAHGKEMKDVVTNITYMDRSGKIYTIQNEDAKFEYRNSLFVNQDHIILEVEMQLEKGNAEEIQSKMAEYATYRKQKQPIEYPSAGSTFKRGVDFITAKLIDDCGLKGYQIGGAQISEKHAGFIINKENATAQDVIKLMKYTKEQVYNKFGKTIEPEIEIIK
ncbi:MAG: UDP-N-acetylmuramate dehydrogenase [Clostridia bacterium]|nr:UDP-N-acetylmuramate dehydrogenase [Clostridia bacterium]